MRAVLIVVFDFCLLCRCGLIQIKCIQSMPFALNVLIASYSTFTPILYCRLGLRTAMLRGKLKMDRHSKSLSTPAIDSYSTSVRSQGSSANFQHTNVGKYTQCLKKTVKIVFLITLLTFHQL